MASYDGSVRIKTTLDQSGFNTGANALLGGLKKIGIAVAAAFSVGKIVEFGKQAVELASDIAEVDNVVSKSFGNMRGEMDELANNAIKSLGMSRLTAYQTGATFMSMGKSMLDSSEDAKNMALELTKLTGNMSSFFNVSQDLASIALKSIYTGETETLKQYGVVMTEVNLKQFALTQGITKQYSAMTQSEKVALRYQYVMSQLSYIGDDFIDTQGSWANQTRILTEQWKEFMSVIGTGLITALTPVVKALNQVISTLITFANAVGKILSSLFGIKAQTVSVGSAADSTASSYENAAGAMEDYTDAANDSASASKKAAKAAQGLSSLDELNNISSQKDSSGSGSGSGSGGAGGGIAGSQVNVVDEEATDSSISQLESKLSELKSFVEGIQSSFASGWKKAFKGLDISNRVQPLQDNLKKIGDSVKSIVTDPQVTDGFTSMVSTWATSLGTVAGSMTSIGTSIATNLAGGISEWLDTDKDRIIEYITGMFDISSRLSEIKANFSLALAEIFTAFESPEAISLTSNLISIFSDTFMGITTLSAKFKTDVIDALTKPIIDNADKIKEALKGTLGIFSQLTGTISDSVKTTFDGINQMYDEHISPLISSIGEGLSSIFGTLLDGYNQYIQPTLSDIATEVDELWKTYVQPMLDSVIGLIGNVADLLNTLWTNYIVPLFNFLAEKVFPVVSEKIKKFWEIAKPILQGICKAIQSIMTILSGVIEFLTGVFSGDWEKAWKGIKKIFKGVWDLIKSIVSTIITTIATIIKQKVEEIKTKWNTVWTAIKDIVSTIFNSIKTKITDVIGKIKDKISEKIKAIKDKWNEVFTGMKDKTKEIFDGIWDAIKGVINSIIDGVESMANAVVTAINTVIKALNKFKINVPKIKGVTDGFTLGFNLGEISKVSIPRLANGGITTGSTLANIGEAGREAVLPLDKNTAWMDDLATRLASKMQNNVTFKVEGDPNGIFKVTQKQANEYFRRTGNSAFAY